MNDPLDDMIHLRMAGYYTAGVDPDEDCVHIAESAIQPQSPAANRWGHAHGLSEYARLDAEETARLQRPPSVADIPGVLRKAAADASLIDERDMLRGIVTGFLASDLKDSRSMYCRHCGELVWRTQEGERVALPPETHRPDCPWRQAAEYIARAEAAE